MPTMTSSSEKIIIASSAVINACARRLSTPKKNVRYPERLGAQKENKHRADPYSKLP
jgi:hypothetical protein